MVGIINYAIASFKAAMFHESTYTHYKNTKKEAALSTLVLIFAWIVPTCFLFAHALARVITGKHGMMFVY